ncbi:hypothetical protein [Ancylobacter terrae]|uniref:hypothetical protein n=1 Tax=Ancylobacter sp. sgz301288 TaxID=3342077 RepID=UPI003860000B
MSSTFVTLGRDARGVPTSDPDRQVGFWIDDARLMVWLRLLALHVPGADTRGSEADLIRHQWLLASAAPMPGCVPHGFAEATATDSGFEIVRMALDSLSTALAHADRPFSAEALNLLRFDGIVWQQDMDIAALRQVAATFRDLVDFRLTSTAGSPPLMPGNPRGAADGSRLH